MSCKECEDTKRAIEMTLVRNPYGRSRPRPTSKVVICVPVDETARLLRLILETGDCGQLQRKLTALAEGLEKERGPKKLQQLITTTD